MIPDHIQTLILNSRLSWKEQLLALVRPSIRLIPFEDPASSPAEITSRLGGIPDMPSDISWPIWNGKPLLFLGQISCSQFHGIEGSNMLPSEGLFSFFYDGIFDLYEISPKDVERWRVFYWNQTVSLYPFYPPLVQAFPPSRLRPILDWTLPPFEGLPQFEINITWDKMYGPEAQESIRQEGEQYLAILHELSQMDGARGPVHRSLGYPDWLQSPMGEQASALLFQIDSDDRVGMKWGDIGRLYYCIGQEALQERRTDTVQLYVQTT